MDPQTLIDCTGCSQAAAAVYAPLFDHAIEVEGFTTPAQQAAFIGQLAYESGLFLRTEENLFYGAARLVAVWPNLFAMPPITDGMRDATQYAGFPEKLANLIYANRLGNGDESSGDGWAFRGRGLIQLTGRERYQQFEADTGVPATSQPELLAAPGFAVQSAQWYWKWAGLDAHARLQDWDGLTRAINGGLNGLSDRVALIERALNVLGG